MKMRLNKRYRTTTPMITTTTILRGDQRPPIDDDNDDDDNNVDEDNHDEYDIEAFVPLGVKNQPVTVPPIYFTNERDNTQRRINSLPLILFICDCLPVLSHSQT